MEVLFAFDFYTGYGELVVNRAVNAQLLQMAGASGVLQTRYKVYAEMAAVMTVRAAVNRSRMATITRVRIRAGRYFWGGSEVRGAGVQGVWVL